MWNNRLVETTKLFGSRFGSLSRVQPNNRSIRPMTTSAVQLLYIFALAWVSEPKRFKERHRTLDGNMQPDSLAEVQGIEMNDHEIDQFLLRQGFGVLSLTDGSEAYGVPVSFGYDGESRLFFVFLRVGIQSKKERFAESTEKASFSTYEVVSKYNWRSVIASGRLHKVSHDEWDDVVAAIDDNAWYPSLFSEAEPMQDIQAWEFQIEEVSGQSSKQ